VRVYESHLFRHQCRCSQERVKGMLRSLPRDEIESLAIDGVVRYHLRVFVIKITRSMKKNVRLFMLTLRKRLKFFDDQPLVISPNNFFEPDANLSSASP